MPYAIAEEDRRFVEEFRRQPIGKHSPGLNRVLTSLRCNPSGRQLVLLTIVPFRAWVIAILPAERAAKIDIESDVVFDSREAAEWAVFCRRWRERTGQPLE
jgi:hypothetical protein